MRSNHFQLIIPTMLCSAVPLTGTETVLSRGPASGAAIAREFLATLDDAARQSVQFDFDVPERKRWRRDPGPRPGIALRDMTNAQRALVDRLLESVLSDRGLETVRGIMQEQNLLAPGEEGLGAGYFWLAFYGAPGQGHWAWRLGGHHVSLHLTYQGSDVLSATPVLMGGEREGEPAQRWAGYEALRARELRAREILEGCDSLCRERISLGDLVPEGLALSEPASLPWAEAEKGVSIADLTAQQQVALRHLVNEYLFVFEDTIARALAGTPISKPGPPTRFAWAGREREGDSHYYRLSATGLLIEYWNSGFHMHSLLRTDNDFGGAPAVETAADRIDAHRRAGEFDKAFAAFREARTHARSQFHLYDSLHQLLMDPRLVANDESHWGRAVLREHARTATARLIPPREPGEPTRVVGQVKTADGHPVSGALLYLFQADDAGRYTPHNAMDEPNSRLFAFLRTGADGRFEFQTIYPGPYPQRKDVEGDARFVPRHVHFEVTADGYEFRRGQMVFDDDPRMTPYWYDWARQGNHPVAHVARNPDGQRQCACDIVLKKK
jgi:protocatechuate 3,4-dioxygenase beta subunit